MFLIVWRFLPYMYTACITYFYEPVCSQTFIISLVPRYDGEDIIERVWSDQNHDNSHWTISNLFWLRIMLLFITSSNLASLNKSRLRALTSWGDNLCSPVTVPFLYFQDHDTRTGCVQEFPHPLCIFCRVSSQLTPSCTSDT